ncbi:helix-turn-helix domain-containing protein [Catenulispora subtropica]|uniref:helix-turn-helix domain-containing protein n=1 Tax=Catenulispora subtropica TaxID=450798 RepID=UPI003CD0675B
MDESVRGTPHAALSHDVAFYSGYRQAGIAPAEHRGLPSPYLTLIVTIDEPLSVAAHPDPEQAPGDFGTLLGGLHTSPATIVHEGRQSGVQLMVNPLAARGLLGMPAGAVAGVDVAADEVLGRDVAEVQERLREAADWPARFAAVDAWLMRRRALVDARRPVAPEVERAWRRLVTSGGAVPVPELADEVGWSTRHLAARFRQEIGLTPKAAARVVRFDRARRALAARVRAARPHVAPSRGLGLADLAAEHGYFDQAHLDREFRALAGCAPVAWVAEEFRNIQAARHAGG